APPSLQLHLDPLLLRLHHGLLDLRFSRQSNLLHLGPPDPQCHPGSSALCLHLGLLSHLLRCRHPSSTMAPPFVGSTVGRLHGCGLGPTCLLLLQVPHVFSLALPS
ncbi:hypothetical protein M9458_015545, partial [Cirrhinus mrigala]